MRVRHTLVIAVAIASSLVLAGPAAQLLRAQGTAAADSAFRRAQRLVNNGDAVAGRALVDSLVRASREGSNDRAEALFWRGMLAADSAAADGDFITIVIDHPLSPRAPDALLRLGNAELARGDGAAALARFDRLLLDYPTSAVAGEAWFAAARVRMSGGDAVGACAALDSAKLRLRAGDVERRNQVTFAAQSCASLVAARAAAPPSGTPPATPPTAPPVAPPVAPPTTPPTAAPPARTPPAGIRTPTDTAVRAPRWSAQMAAFKTKAEADRLVRNLKARGVDARVDHLALFHVRTGMLSTRAQAAALVASLKRKQITAFVVEAPRREP